MHVLKNWPRELDIALLHCMALSRDIPGPVFGALSHNLTWIVSAKYSLPQHAIRGWRL